MSNLFIWTEGYQKRYVKKKGVPSSINCIVMDIESPYVINRNNSNTSSNEWASYNPTIHAYPPDNKFKLPEELYLEIAESSNINFDFLARGDLKIVSERFLGFLNKIDEAANYEISKITRVFNTKRVDLDVQQYYVLRHFKYDDELINFHKEVRKWFLYPNMDICENVTKKIFALYELPYRPAFIFREDIKSEIERCKFIGPEIYSIDKYPYVYKGMPEK